MPLSHLSTDLVGPHMKRVEAPTATRLDDDVSQAHFAPARDALHALRDGLKAVYMEECIPY